MNFYFTYQQSDTLKNQGLKDLKLKVDQPAVLNVGRKIISTKALKIDSAPVREVQKPEPKPLTAAQIRYIEKRNEEKLLVDSSRFIKPQEEVKMDLHPVAKAREVILPSRELNRVNYDWVTIVLTLSLLIYASVRIPYGKYIEHLFQSLFNYPTATRMFRERNYSLVHGAFRLDLDFYFVFSVFVFQALKYFEVDLPVKNLQLFLFCFLGVIGYFLLKRMLYAMVGIVNNGQSETSEYWFNINNYNRILGMFLFPVVAIVAFSPFFKPLIFIVLGLIMTIVFYGMSLQRGVLILLRKQFSIFYLFLYLCTLEILPLLLIFKLVLV